MKLIKKLSIILMILTIIIRVFGFIREVLIAYLFGTSSIVEMYLVSQMIGEIFGNVILVGTFSTFVLLMLNQNKIQLKQLLMIGLGVTLPIVILIGVFSGEIASFLGSNSSSISIRDLEKSIVIIAPTILFLSLGTIISSYLNFKERYIAPMLGILLQNVSFIIVALVLVIFIKDAKYIILPQSYFWSTLIYFIYLALLVLKYEKKEIIDKNRIPFREVLLVFGSVFLNTLIMKILIFTDRYFLIQGEPGTVAFYNYAMKFLNLPLAIIGTALINIFFIKYLQSDSKFEQENNTFKLLFFAGCIASFFIYNFSDFIIQTAYGYGAFNEQDISKTATMLKYLSGVLPLQIILLYYQKIIFEKYNQMKVMFYIIVPVIVNLVTNIFLIEFIMLESTYSVIISTYLSLAINVILLIDKKIYLINAVYFMKIIVLLFILKVILEVAKKHIELSFLQIVICILVTIFLDKTMRLNLIKEFFNLK